MSGLYITNEDALRSMIERWLHESDVIAPVRQPPGDVLFESIQDAAACEFDFELPAAPPKEWMLPQLETLLDYRLGDRPAVNEVFDAVRRVLFGVRPCDMSAINILCEVMSGEHPDLYCMARARNLTCIVLACARVFDGHFCHLTGTGPWLDSGYDWQLTPLRTEYVLEIGSERGKQLLEDARDLVEEANESVHDALQALRAKAVRDAVKFADIEDVRKRLEADEISASLLEELASQCQACGGCSFVCPTCFCFSMLDVPTGPASGERRRQWDSCAFAGFTRLAGDEKRCTAKAQRMRRRLCHKLSGRTDEGRGVRCVGCGRCAQVCLGEVDMAAILKKICERAEHR